MWEARLHLTAKSQGLVAYLLMHMGGRREGGQQRHRRAIRWGENEVEGLTFPKEQSQLYLMNLKGTETQEESPVTGLGGPRGPI